MSLPGNGIFVVRGELTILMTAMRKGTRWSGHSYQDDDVDILMKNFQELKEILNSVDDLRFIEPVAYLTPFLNVIRSEETTGPVTSLALAAVNKFLSYGIIEPTHSSIANIVHDIADAITHARFVGTDQSSDGVVLMRILQVLRTLTLAPEGATLTNESLCEIMLSCFRICFETRLNELLRRTAEHYLKDMVQLVFMRLPQFSETLGGVVIKQLKMRPGAIDQTRRRRSRTLIKKTEKKEPDTTSQVKPQQKVLNSNQNATNNIVDMQGQISQNSHQTNSPNINEVSQSDEATNPEEKPSKEATDVTNNIIQEQESVNDVNIEEKLEEPPIDCQYFTSDQDYVNERGIRFTPRMQEEVPRLPYGLACVRELLRFLISLCNPRDKQNNEVMIHLGLSLLTVAFEVSADHIGKFATLLALVKDDLCRNLFALLNSERLSIFAADLQLSFLMFESLRTHLKYQLECYLNKIMEIIVSDNVRVTYEHKEIALDNLLQLWRIPGFVTELYLNYDCNMYCANLYEEITKLLAKNAISVTSGVYNVHLLSLDALLTVIETIERHCEKKTIEEDVDSYLGKISRVKMSEVIPCKQELADKKSIKKWLPQGTEYFNQKPKKGIQFLQEHGVLKPELDPHEIALFLRENSSLNKTMIGEYISNRGNLTILDAFVKTFDFTDVRIDEALRAFLETFRLPGEAPTISLILEHFAEHWHKSNGEPFANVDSAFTLAYAIIMLNVDQHNENAKKQTIPMSANAFKKNLKGVNGEGDFDEEMLDEIYNTIKNDEIVMPAEQTGIVRENYFWKLLLRKGASKEGVYIHTNSNAYDFELFSLLYGPIVSALSSIFEKSDEQITYKKMLKGFERCAFVAANFGMTKNLDMLILSICKFTLFYNNQQKQNNLLVKFGANVKGQLALKTVFTLIHRHGDNVREGWKNVFDLILALYSNGLLPKSYIEAEDFIESSGKIILIYEEAPTLPKQDTGLLSSLYSYMVSAENLSKIPTPEEQQYIQTAKECIKECNLENVITDSKFLHEEALLEVITGLVDLSRGPEFQKGLEYNYNENVTVFFLELLVKIVIQNRDRVMIIWQNVHDHIYTLVMNASLFDYQFLLERSVIALLRIAIRLMRNEEMSPVVLQSLRMLLLLKPSILCRISRQISFGLYELLKTSAQNIHTANDWMIIFTLLECVGAGAHPPKPVAEGNTDQGTKSDGENPTNSDEDEINTDRGYTSDSELTKSPKHVAQRSTSPVFTLSSPVGTPNTGGWILVGNEGEIQGRTVPPTQYGLCLERNLGPHDPSSLIKCCESLAFLVRDVAHITPYNFDVCVHCIRTFVEAGLHGYKNKKSAKQYRPRKKSNSNSNRRKGERNNRKSPTSSPDEDNDSEDDLPSGYHQISIQLLDLMHTLHTRTAQIFKWWAEEGGEIAQGTSLWTQGWCPLLQGIARLCCDTRKHVRMSAITYLQRALLVHDLQTLSGPEWEQCFQRVLFPLLNYLLQPTFSKDMVSMEETRMRAATVLSKVFLHHLTPLLSLQTFSNLWLVILDFMEKYMYAEQSDLLFEAIPESLKNMLLVMDSAKVFDGVDGKNVLWNVTWERIGKFLPNMKEELFKEITEDEIKQKEVKEQVKEIVINQNQPEPVQHNVENATRSSIILQPPATTLPVSSHLFAHLGQMVSTPIRTNHPEPPPKQVIPTSTTQSATNSNPFLSNTATVLQPTLQPGLPYMSNYFIPSNNVNHNFPVLYNGPVTPNVTASEVQPVSIYSEYLENPYNNESTDVKEENLANETSDINSNGNDLQENLISTANYFQSSNYFADNNNSSSNFIPAGSEILYGIEVQSNPMANGQNIVNNELPNATSDV